MENEKIDMRKLLFIQKQIENSNLDKNLVYNLTKDLSNDEKMVLKEIYKAQIQKLEYSLQNYKRKIINTRNKLYRKISYITNGKDGKKAILFLLVKQ